MRASSHRQLGLYLADQYLPNIPRKYFKAFITGCIQPDKNPTTYFKGSIRNRWLHGHDYNSAKKYMFRLVRILQKRRNWNMMDYYRLGKLMHYIADAFTHAHNESFSGDIFAHRRYEQILHTHFIKRLKQPFFAFLPAHRDIATAIENYHEIYRETPPDVSTDIDYCVGVSCFVVKMLKNRVKPKIFSI